MMIESGDEKTGFPNHTIQIEKWIAVGVGVANGDGAQMRVISTNNFPGIGMVPDGDEVNRKQSFLVGKRSEHKDFEKWHSYFVPNG